MGRLFAVPLPTAGAAITTAAELWELRPATNQPIRLHSIFIQQNTELGDAAEEQIVLSINRKTGAATTGTGTAAVVNPIDYVGTAATAGCAGKVNMTANGTGGSTVVVWVEAFNLRAGYERIFPPESRFQFVIPTGGATPVGMTVKVEVAPTDSVTFFGVLVFEEES